VDDFAKSIEGFYRVSILLNVIWGGLLFIGILYQVRRKSSSQVQPTPIDPEEAVDFNKDLASRMKADSFKEEHAAIIIDNVNML